MNRTLRWIVRRLLGDKGSSRPRGRDPATGELGDLGFTCEAAVSLGEQVPVSALPVILNKLEADEAVYWEPGQSINAYDVASIIDAHQG